MTDKEKRELKDGIISIFKNFNILDHTATIGGLRDDILKYIDSMQEKSVKEDLEDFALQYAGHHAPYDSCMQEVEDAVKAGAKWQKKQMMEKADLNEKKDVYPQSQWKPSKIQMSALKVASGLANIDMQAILYSLYNDLKNYE